MNIIENIWIVCGACAWIASICLAIAHMIWARDRRIRYNQESLRLKELLRDHQQERPAIEASQIWPTEHTEDTEGRAR